MEGVYMLSLLISKVNNNDGKKIFFLNNKNKNYNKKKVKKILKDNENSVIRIRWECMKELKIMTSVFILFSWNLANFWVIAFILNTYNSFIMKILTNKLYDRVILQRHRMYFPSIFGFTYPLTFYDKVKFIGKLQLLNLNKYIKNLMFFFTK